MSTRCVVNFCYYQKPEAKIYIHSDGYPDGPHGIQARLQRFFTDVQKQTRDTRFDYPTYLAARFVVWAAREYASNPENPLDFLGVGVTLQDPGDIEYRYYVDCDASDPPASVRYSTA